MIDITYAEAKEFLTAGFDKHILTRTKYYQLVVSDGAFAGSCKIDRSPSDTTDLDDFEANILTALHSRTIMQTRTEFEAPELVPQFVRGDASFGTGTTATIYITVPGTFPAVTRFIRDGYVFTDSWDPGTYVSKCGVDDPNNKLGQGAGYVAKDYIDGGVATANKGWYLWEGNGGTTSELDVENSGGVGSIYAELRFFLEITKPTANVGATKAYANIFWNLKE